MFLRLLRTDKVNNKKKKTKHIQRRAVVYALFLFLLFLFRGQKAESSVLKMLHLQH